MITSEDLYVDESEELNYIEQNKSEGHSDNEKKNDNVEKKAVKTKKNRNILPKINIDRLKSTRGLIALKNHFKNTKYKGRGYEQEDLSFIMKTYEYWCHRLFPKFPFVTCIERIDKLGHKKEIQNYIKTIRMNTIEDNDHLSVENVELEYNTNVSTVDTNVDESYIDEILMEKIRQNKERAEKIRRDKFLKKQNLQNENISDASSSNI